MLVITVFFIGLPIGCSYAALQHIFPNQVRGVASAIVLFVVNFTGLGLGSFLPGFLSEYVFQDPLKVGQAIALTVVIAAALRHHDRAADDEALPPALRRDGGDHLACCCCCFWYSSANVGSHSYGYT